MPPSPAPGHQTHGRRVSSWRSIRTLRPEYTRRRESHPIWPRRRNPDRRTQLSPVPKRTVGVFLPGDQFALSALNIRDGAKAIQFGLEDEIRIVERSFRLYQNHRLHIRQPHISIFPPAYPTRPSAPFSRSLKPTPPRFADHKVS